ncbi:MAG: hypothetical protein JOZ42_06790, partial [Acetobacteraceae bacterium]|nr:hypothetical protein [Acetobacteraceae bacterium]
MPDTLPPGETLTPVKRALIEIRRLRAQLAAAPSRDAEKLAIVGMAVRLPGGIASPGAFWEVLREGEHRISGTPRERWDSDALFDADADAPGKTYSRHAGFLNDVEQFDAAFFGITPREAESMDPQQRMLLELAWEALEDALIPPTALAGSRTGVFVGLSNSDYGRLLLEQRDDIDAYSSFGVALSIAAGRISYALDLRGPSLVVDTACSSSLAAVHLACTSLRRAECDLAIVGGSNLVLTPEATISFSHARMLARDGQCKTFDAAADGYVRGEGCVTLVLKRLRDATESGDRVLAVIRGCAINHDGRSAGLTAPNGPAQEAVIAAALRDAGVLPADIDYVEAHGTGTALGDPIEVGALAAAYSPGRAPDRKLLVGSVKTNLGHLEAAAGLAGLAKVVLSLQHETLPPHRNLAVPNPHLAWQSLPVSVVTAPTPWRPGGRPRRAGLSSFGFSGSNVHLVLEEAPAPLAVEHSSPERDELFVLSARSAAALHALAESYRAWLRAGGHSLADICYSAATGRAHHRHRLALVARDRRELAAELEAWLARSATDAPASASVSAPQLAFFCPARIERAADYLAALSAACPPFAAICNDPSTGPAVPGAESASLQRALGRFCVSLGLTPVAAFGVGSGVVAAADLHPSPAMAVTALAPSQIADAARAPGADFGVVLGTAADAAPVSAMGWPALLGASPDFAWSDLLRAFQALYGAGADCDWRAFYRGTARRKVSLPTYRFQRQRFWRPVSPRGNRGGAGFAWTQLVA